MTVESSKPLFTVIIATRDRPALFAKAFVSVLEQTFKDIEIIIVNDGSDQESEATYETVVKEARAKHSQAIDVLTLIRRPNGHGPSFVRNYGVDHSRGQYLCFLDDDDQWIDRDYLTRMSKIIIHYHESVGEPVDLLLSNQVAFSENGEQSKKLWLAELAPMLDGQQRARDEHECFKVTVQDLMGIEGFCHINCMNVRKDLWKEVGGLDERIRYEEDRDVYLRLIDHSKLMVHDPSFVSRHNIPAPKDSSSITSSMSSLTKRLNQLQVLSKAVLFTEHKVIREYGMAHTGFTLKKITEELAVSGQYKSALYYARQALGAKPTFKWFAYTLWLLVCRVIRSGS